MGVTREVPVPLPLRVRRRVRRAAPVRTLSVLRQVVAHPANAGGRWAAMRRAVAWQLRSRTISEPLDLTVHGDLILRCHPRSNAASNVIYFTERHDPAEMEVIERWVQPGDVVVDVGANIGTYTLLLAKLVGPTGTVVAIEPGATAAQRLAENVDLNRLDQVQIVECAIGRADGTGQMTVGADVSNTLAVGPGSHELVDVPVRSLDSLLGVRRPTMLKLDVEGYEFEALSGAASVLAQAQPVMLIELTNHLLERAGSSRAQVEGALADLGYQLWYPRMSGAQLHLDTSPHGSNAVAVPASRREAFETLIGA